VEHIRSAQKVGATTLAAAAAKQRVIIHFEIRFSAQEAFIFGAAQLVFDEEELIEEGVTLAGPGRAYG
jgi:hypothetical protein